MAPRPTETNPAGLPMQRVNITVPVEDINKMNRIAADSHKPRAVVYREAVQEYLKKNDREERKKTLKVIK